MTKKFDWFYMVAKLLYLKRLVGQANLATLCQKWSSRYNLLSGWDGPNSKVMVAFHPISL